MSFAAALASSCGVILSKVFSIVLAAARFLLGESLSEVFFSPSNNPLSFAYSLFVYYKFDEQILIGLNSGQQQGGIPVLGSLYMRLPLGSVFLPVVIGDIGYLIKF